MRMAKAGEVPIYGMDYKDKRNEALTWLREWGNPYPVVAVDESGARRHKLRCLRSAGNLCDRIRRGSSATSRLARCVRTSCKGRFCPWSGSCRTNELALGDYSTHPRSLACGGRGAAGRFADNPQVEGTLEKPSPSSFVAWSVRNQTLRRFERARMARRTCAEKGSPRDDRELMMGYMGRSNGQGMVWHEHDAAHTTCRRQRRADHRCCKNNCRQCKSRCGL